MNMPRPMTYRRAFEYIKIANSAYTFKQNSKWATLILILILSISYVYSSSHYHHFFKVLHSAMNDMQTNSRHLNYYISFPFHFGNMFSYIAEFMILSNFFENLILIHITNINNRYNSNLLLTKFHKITKIRGKKRKLSSIRIVREWFKKKKKKKKKN